MLERHKKVGSYKGKADRYQFIPYRSALLFRPVQWFDCAEQNGLSRVTAQYRKHVVTCIVGMTSGTLATQAMKQKECFATFRWVRLYSGHCIVTRIQPGVKRKEHSPYPLKCIPTTKWGSICSSCNKLQIVKYFWLFRSLHMCVIIMQKPHIMDSANMEKY